MISTSTILSRIGSDGLNRYKDILEAFGVAALLATFIFAFALFFIDREINKRQAEALRNFELALSKQKELTAKAEKELLEVKKRQEPRNLLPADVENLKKYLEGKPKSNVRIVCVNLDQEGCTFAEQIKKVLTDCGWNVEGDGVTRNISRGNPTGIYIHMPSGRNDIPTPPDTVPAGFPVLVGAFRDVLGIELDQRAPYGMGLPTDTVELFVGFK